MLREGSEDLLRKCGEGSGVYGSFLDPLRGPDRVTILSFFSEDEQRRKREEDTLEEKNLNPSWGMEPCGVAAELIIIMRSG